MILLIGGEKGGTGKTTITTNLAAMRAATKKDVLLIDTDRQESASSWCYVREEENISPRVSSILKFGAGLRGEIEALKGKYDDILIDSGGRDSIELRSSLLVADKAIIPIRATQFDLWTISRLSKLIDEILQVNEKLRVFLALNAASTNPSVKETNEAEEFVKSFPNLRLMKSVIRERIAFHRAAAEGRCVHETKPLDIKAQDEINNFYKEAFDEI